MTVSGKNLPVGLRRAAVFALDANGRPAASGTTAYTGLAFSGPKAFDINIPEARRISHYGGDRVMAVDFLPPQEGVSAELRVAGSQHDVLALLQGIEETSVGAAKEIGYFTSKQGEEPQVGLLLYQKALDTVSGKRRWRSIVIPACVCSPMPAGFGENPIDFRFSVAITNVNARLWGDTLDLVTDGYESAGLFEYMTENQPVIAAFLADGVAGEFLFPADKQAVSTDTIAVFKNGAAVTSGVTKAVTGVTFTTPPSVNDNITIFYETA